MSERFSLKDHLFNPVKVNLLASQIKSTYSAFDDVSFVSDVLEAFPKLELKARIAHISDMFERYLPQDFIASCDILVASLPVELDSTRCDDDFGDFIYAPHAYFIAQNGCKSEHLSYSLNALKECTKRFSVEFAIRDFINKYENQTFEFLSICAQDDNYHIRRLSSEGLRPSLPWAHNINIEYIRPLQILENLYSDKTRYVTRSVANHLNDISKKDPSIVIQTLKKWQKSNKQDEDEMNYIISHSLRTLVKRGNKQALEFLGFSSSPHIKISNFNLSSDEILVGTSLEFSFDVSAFEDENLIVDYIIYFQNKNAQLSPKVYKITKLNIEKNKCEHIVKKHMFKANMSTRKLYEGLHKISLQINGQIYKTTNFHINN